MTTPIQVHWHEGLFLLPHHLQLLQRQVHDAAGAERALGWAYPYGVVDARLSGDALERGEVRFERLRAIMPDGTEVDAPGNADLRPLDVKRHLGAEAVTVYLALPSYDASGANALEIGRDDPLVRSRFRVAKTAVKDENAGDNPQDLLLRRLNVRLLVQGEDASGLQTLPILRVRAGVGDDAGRPKADLSFVPPCLGLNGSSTLRNLLRDLSDAVLATRGEQANQLGKSGWDPENVRGPQFLQLMRLRTLNRFAGRLPAMLASPVPGGAGLPLLHAYLELRELLGELAALAPDRDPFDAPRYDHDDPGPVFAGLDQRIRALLKPVGSGRVKKIKFTPDGADFVLAEPMGEEDFGATGFFLGIKAKGDGRAMRALVESGEKFKVMPQSLRVSSVGYIYGVKVEEERDPPPLLPRPSGLHYFRLVPSESQRRWGDIKKEKRIALVCPEGERLESDEVVLYMTFP